MSRLNIPGRWEAHYVGPNTPYADEPSETVPIGWRVIAVAGEGKEVQAEIRIDLFDADDNDVSEQVARIIATALATACIPAAGVLATACWAMWPRHINHTPIWPGSWVHARTTGSVDELIGAYLVFTAEEINASQTLALAGIAHQKFRVVRIMLPLLGATIAVLLAALATAIL